MSCPSKRHAVFSKATAGNDNLSSKTSGSPRFEAIITCSLSGITPKIGIPKIFEHLLLTSFHRF